MTMAKPMIRVASQLAVFLANKPGALARLCAALNQGGINIYAMATSDTVDHNVVRMVVDNPRAALRLLEAHNTLVVESDVVMVEGYNKSGSLAHIAGLLAAAKINIEYAYCATLPEAKRGLLILRPSQVAKALAVLNKNLLPEAN
jgi:hypothetical protein